jgi:hypothetical protein
MLQGSISFMHVVGWGGGPWWMHEMKKLLSYPLNKTIMVVRDERFTKPNHCPHYPHNHTSQAVAYREEKRREFDPFRPFNYNNTFTHIHQHFLPLAPFCRHTENDFFMKQPAFSVLFLSIFHMLCHLVLNNSNNN